MDDFAGKRTGAGGGERVSAAERIAFAPDDLPKISERVREKKKKGR